MFMLFCMKGTFTILVGDLRIDSHKLIYHPGRVADFLNGSLVYPISCEVSLSSACNHRCIFCALDYTGFKPRFMDKDVILDTLKKLHAKGLKSVVFSGEGEPFLNKYAPDIINASRQMGLDVGVSSNGAVFSHNKSNECLGLISWIRFSVAAGTAALYSQIHNTSESDFHTAISNISNAVEVRNANDYKTTIGVQMILIPENVSEVSLLAEMVKEIGVDYFTVKPYSQNPNSINRMNGLIDYNSLVEIEKDLAKLQTNRYKIYFRREAMQNLYKDRGYDKCYGMNFFTHIDTLGNVAPCITMIGDSEYSFGNIYERDILEIWNNKTEIVNKIMDEGTDSCREICRLDAMNKYLYELKNLSSVNHVNFI